MVSYGTGCGDTQQSYRYDIPSRQADLHEETVTQPRLRLGGGTGTNGWSRRRVKCDFLTATRERQMNQNEEKQQKYR